MEIENLINPHILNLKPYASARSEYTIQEGIFLDANENPEGKYNRYPDPYQFELVQKIGFIKKVPYNKVVLGNGSDEIIDATVRVFCNPQKDKILLCPPTYGMYEVVASIQNVDCVKVPLKDNFQLQLDLIFEAIKKESIKIIFLCSPNNPTGNLLQLQDIITILESFSGIVFLDEAYIDFSDQPSLAGLIDQYPNLIISQTLSKAYGMAGLRIGLGIMTPKLVSYYLKVLAPYNISVVNQKLALEQLANECTIKQRVRVLLEQKSKLLNALQQISIVITVYPSAANFLLVAFKNAPSVYNSLLKEKIIVRNRCQEIPNTLRISVGNPQENEQLIMQLKRLSNG